MNNPPPQIINLTIVLHIKRLYIHIYNVGSQLSKRNKLGIHKEIETRSIQCLTLAIDAALRSRPDKVSILQELRRNTELLKHLIRTEYELKIIRESTYLNQTQMLVNISMMATAWYKSVAQNHPL